MYLEQEERTQEPLKLYTTLSIDLIYEHIN
jgi:hypothetical protein